MTKKKKSQKCKNDATRTEQLQNTFENKILPDETYAMGAKTQANAKDSNEKRPALRCDVCQRDFLTLSAIKSHTMAKHPEKHKQMLSNEADTKDEKKTALVPPISRVSKRLQQKKPIDDEVVTQSNRKTIFQCPKCLKEFGVFFPAHRHIQNRHCEDKDGNPVSPDSMDLIKPIRKEICTACDKPHHGDQPCGATPTTGSEKGMYCCLACKQVFQCVTSFDEHVVGNHEDSVGVTILENMNEFLNWKSKIEAKLHIKYLTLSNTMQKQYYQCNYVSPQNSSDITHLCPSVMIVREFSKGIHVRYHKNHYGHTCESYMPQSDDNNSVTDYNEVYKDLVKSGADIYIKLRDLMKSITLRASTLKRAKLKPLYVSALEMQAYLNGLQDEGDEELSQVKKENFPNSVAPVPKRAPMLKSASKPKNENDKNEKNENEPTNVDLKSKKTMTDDQIAKVLEGTRASTRLKRKSESSPAPEPKNKHAKKSEINTDLKENNSQLDITCTEIFESPKPNLLPFSQSPSFNDSYKQFIDSTSPKPEIEEKHTKRVKKEVVKTKIGQFTPSPKKNARVQLESENATKKKKKAPGNSTLKDLKLNNVEYEVVEQENDCNILILKI